MDLLRTAVAYPMKQNALSKYHVHALQVVFVIVCICLLFKIAADAQESAPVSSPASSVNKTITPEPPERIWWGLKPGDWFQLGGAVATTAAAVISAIAILVAVKQLREAQRQLEANRRIAEGEFLLHLEQLLREHHETNKNLRPEGKWKDGKGPSEDDMADVDAYMGLFERVNALVKDGLISLDDVEYFYGYRITNIARNPKIRTDKLESREGKYFWTGFKELLQKVEDKRKERTGRQL